MENLEVMEKPLVQAFSIPSKQATKQLRIKSCSNNNRKIVVSSNWLPLFDFNPKDKVVEKSLGTGKGIVIERVYDMFDAPLKTKQVYSREYKSRRNSPLEVLLEVASQKLIQNAFPSTCKTVHVQFTQGKIVIRPITTFQEKAIKQASFKTRHAVFAARSSGVDLYAMENQGFSIHSLVEFRPKEKRDKKRDFSETGAITALRNLRSGIRNLFNEDINHIDMQQLSDSVAESPFTTFVCSPQCDDWSPVKGGQLKANAVEDLSTTIDMTFDILRIVEAITPPVIQLENVVGWYNSDLYRAFAVRLRRLGYTENLIFGDPRDYGGLTSRKRGYAVFSCLPAEFSFETPKPRRSVPIWEEIKSFLPECRDITQSKSINDGAACGRLRTIKESSLCSPTFLKSQSRMAKDTVCVHDKDRYYFPSENLQKHLMGIDMDFKLDCVRKDIGYEILGQSIDGALHYMVIRSIKKHIDDYFQD